MHTIIDNFFDACTDRIVSRVAEVSSQQLPSPNLVEALRKETTIDIPHLGIDHLADPEIGTEYFQASHEPEDVTLPEGDGHVPFVLYKVPINGPVGVVHSLISNTVKENRLWIEDHYIYYKRYNLDLMTSSEVRESIKDEFKQKMLSLNNQLHDLMAEAKELRSRLDYIINSSIKAEINRRNQELSIRSSLNPFS